MDITSKQRAFLRSKAGTQSAIMQIGKDGVSENLIKTLNDALESRELIKISVLETAYEDPKVLLEELCETLNAVPVATCGRKLIMYRQAGDKKKRKIELPKA